MELYGHRPNRRRGQNFLIHKATANRFVDNALATFECKPKVAVEIGPGVGQITHVLCQRFERVVAIETDKRLIKLWETEIKKPDNLEVIEGDATNFDFAKLSKRLGTRLVIFGNLPFNVSTKILERLFKQWSFVAFAQLCFQAEVADRIQAKPGTKDYGSLTVLSQTFTDVTRSLKIKRGEYYPQPKVDSTVLSFHFLEKPRIEANDLLLFEAFVRQGFLFRRKTMVNAFKISKRFSSWKESLQKALVSLGHPANIRIERLSLDELYKVFKTCHQEQGES